jgi:hypothetical protein
MELLPDLSEPTVDEIELPPDACSLDFLRAVYRDRGQPMQRRMRAAIEALPFERPKLAVVANVHGFADQMKELARQRYGGGNVIDAKPVSKIPVEEPQSEP